MQSNLLAIYLILAILTFVSVAVLLTPRLELKWGFLCLALLTFIAIAMAGSMLPETWSAFSNRAAGFRHLAPIFLLLIGLISILVMLFQEEIAAKLGAKDDLNWSLNQRVQGLAFANN